MGLGDWLDDFTNSKVGKFLSDTNDTALAVITAGALGKPDAFWTDEPDRRSVMPSMSQPLEGVMHGINWVYDNGISQPISTFLLMGAQNENLGDVGGFFSADSWSRTWDAANNISPGEAIGVMGATDSAGAGAVVNSPLMYAAPPLSDLPPGWADMSPEEQQEFLRGAGMPAVGNQEIEKLRREHEMFTFATGAMDFAFRWWADPVVLAGKAAGTAKELAITKPRPKGGWSPGQIDGLMADSTMAKAQAYLWENRADPALINNLSMFKKSALGPRAGSIVSRLQSPEEVNLFLRTSLGDEAARLTLMKRNREAAWRLDQDVSRLGNAELSLPRVIGHGNTRAQLMIENRIDELTQRVNADTDLVARYDAMLAHYGELDAINLTRFSFARAERRTAAGAAYKTGPALGTNKARPGGLAKSRVYAKDFFGPSLTVVRSFKEAHPNGMMALDDLHPEAIDELRGQIARIPGIGPNIRGELLNKYLKTTTEGERLAQVEEIQKLAVNKIAEKHGLTADEARALYRQYEARILDGKERLRRYSAGTHPDEKIHLDEFLDSGGQLALHPNMATKLVNDHILIDLAALDTTLARHASAFSALRTSAVGNPDWIVNGMDWFSHLWKFGTLFRLGYIPRVLGDDIAGQTARLGAATMTARAGWGVKNLATNLAHWRPASHLQAQEATAREGIKFIDEELRPLQREAEYHRGEIRVRKQVAQADLRRARDRHRRAVNALNATGPETHARSLVARQKLVDKRAADVSRLERHFESVGSGKADRLSRLDDQITELQTQRAASLDAADGLKLAAERGFHQARRTYREVKAGKGVVMPAAFSGERGEYYMKMISSDDSLRTLLQRNKQMIHSNLQKSFGNSGVAISYPQNEALFVQAWHKAINHQIMQDDFARLAVQGKSIDEMTRWLTHTPRGRAYHKRLGIKYSPPERIAASVWHEVDEYMPAMSGVREAALKGEANTEYLAELAKTGQHPLNVHTTQLGEALAGSNSMSRGMDRVTDWWYKWAASIPADRMSRHPLFNQLYEGHAKALTQQRLKQLDEMAARGERAAALRGKIELRDASDLAETARRLALKDTRKLVFDIAHRSDAAHMLRFMSPFFAATTEAWQRWARIIADRPQTVGYASIIFNAPISVGWMQDMDGNRIQRDGTAMTIDPKTGKAVKRLVPKGERYIMARVPKFVAEGPVGKAFGLDASKDLKISQDSMHLVTQGDPFFNPGTGPIVAIPVNEFVKDKPKQAEIARRLGILPFGPTAGSPLFGDTPLGRAADLSMPQTVKNFLTAYDTTDERYQRVKLQIMQQAAYEHAEKGKPMPSAREIADRTKQYWLDSAVWSFVQPAATQRPDKYQFFRDQYNNLRRQDPMTADQKFLERFQESYFIFAQATSDNKIGAQATQAAVELSKRYEQQLAEHPELGALIIGPEGNGPFSPEAYTYQLTHPLVPGGSEMQRTKLSAEEAMKENQRRLGWAKFTAMQNTLTAQLHSAGYRTFADKGAEQFAAQRSAAVVLYGDPLLPDGSENPFYNEEWSKDFHSFDARKYDRLIPGLTDVAYSDMANNPNRSDLRTLQTYLEARKHVMSALAARKAAGGAGTLKAKANKDLAATWAYLVDGLREQDTRFGDLHSRYLFRDMGVDVDELTGEEEN